MEKRFLKKKANSHFDFVIKNDILSKPKRSQIWIETVIYTVIGLVIIGIVLAVVTPTIDKYKDKIIIEQTITALNDFNEKILEVEEGIGSKRIVEFRIKEGILIIDGVEEKIVYILEESKLEYSEPGEEIPHGDIIIKTEEKGRKYDINLILPYENVNITYNGEHEKKTFNPASVPYKLFVENNGSIENKINIDIKESS